MQADGNDRVILTRK